MELTFPHELNELFCSIIWLSRSSLHNFIDPTWFIEARLKAVDLFFKKLLEIEFGEYAQFSELIYWWNPHDWSSKEPNKPHFHNHLNLINVVFDWRGSVEFKTIYRAIVTAKNKFIRSPTAEEIAELTGWSISKVRRWLNTFVEMGLILACTYSSYRSNNGDNGAKNEPHGRKIVYDLAPDFEPLPSPLIRFNPKKFTTEKLEEYRNLWKEIIKEVFGVDLDVLPVVHFADSLIPLSVENFERIVHRLSYCNRHPITDINSFLYKHPNADFDLDWLDHLLDFEPKLIGSRIAQNLSRYVGIEFITTLTSRHFRLKELRDELIQELKPFEERERELINQLRVFCLDAFKIKLDFDDFDSILDYLRENPIILKDQFRLLHGGFVHFGLDGFVDLINELKKISNEKAKLKKELDELNAALNEIEKKIKRIRGLYKPQPKCPICGEPLTPISDKPPEDAPIVWFDPVTKKWVLKIKKRRGG